MRPMARRDSEPGDPMDRLATVRAVENELPKLAFEIGLHVQELEP